MRNWDQIAKEKGALTKGKTLLKAAVAQETWLQTGMKKENVFKGSFDVGEDLGFPERTAFLLNNKTTEYLLMAKHKCCLHHPYTF